MGGTLTLLVIKNKGVTFSDYNLLAFWKLNPISDRGHLTLFYPIWAAHTFEKMAKHRWLGNTFRNLLASEEYQQYMDDLSSNSETDSGSESEKYNSSLYLDDSESDMD